MSNMQYPGNKNVFKNSVHLFRVRPIPCCQPIPDTIGRSCTNTDSGNDVTQLGHMYDTDTTHRDRAELTVTSSSERDDDFIMLRRRRVHDDDIAMTFGDVVVIIPCLL